MKYISICFLVLIAIAACQQTSKPAFMNALTFHASFNNGPDADFALGDKSLYTAQSRRALNEATEGLLNDDHKILNDGKWGQSLRFGKKSDTVIFFRTRNNMKFDPENWSGTISFWLSLDPAVDLEPGYTDPIQITDQRYDDASIWVDFTNINPRDFRLGVFGDKAIWEQDTVNTSPTEEFERRLVRVKNPPFEASKWTHIAITFEALGTAESSYSLYVDGNKIGTVTGIDDPFTWELDQSNIYLGINYTGGMDELSFFSEVLSEEDIKNLMNLEGGISPLL